MFIKHHALPHLYNLSHQGSQCQGQGLKVNNCATFWRYQIHKWKFCHINIKVVDWESGRKKKTSWNNAFPIIPRGRGGGIMGTSLSCSRQSQTCWIIRCAKQFSMSCMDKHLFTDLISLKIIWCIYINQWTFDVLLLEYQIPSGKRIALSWNLRFCKASSMIVRILQNKYKQNLMTAHDRNHLPVSHQCIL